MNKKMGGEEEEAYVRLIRRNVFNYDRIRRKKKQIKPPFKT